MHFSKSALVVFGRGGKRFNTFYTIQNTQTQIACSFAKHATAVVSTLSIGRDVRTIIFFFTFRPGKKVTDVKKGSLQQVIDLGKVELAQKVATLQLQMAQKDDMNEKLKMTVTELQAEHAKSKAEYESTVTRHQKFIDKVDVRTHCFL